MSTPVDSAHLVARAREAASFSWSPYSRFPVGAALLCDDGTIVTGTNVENRSFGLTNCAERSALFAAVSQGRRRFTALAVCCPASAKPVPPCGACRQSLSEFCQPGMPVYYAGGGGKITATTIGALLPEDSLHDPKGRQPSRGGSRATSSRSPRPS